MGLQFVKKLLGIGQQLTATEWVEGVPTLAQGLLLAAQVENDGGRVGQGGEAHRKWPWWNWEALSPSWRRTSKAFSNTLRSAYGGKEP